MVIPKGAYTLLDNIHALSQPRSIPFNVMTRGQQDVFEYSIATGLTHSVGTVMLIVSDQQCMVCTAMLIASDQQCTVCLLFFFLTVLDFCIITYLFALRAVCSY